MNLLRSVGCILRVNGHDEHVALRLIGGILEHVTLHNSGRGEGVATFGGETMKFDTSTP